MTDSIPESRQPPADRPVENTDSVQPPDSVRGEANSSVPSEQKPASIPVENSELRDVLDRYVDALADLDGWEPEMSIPLSEYRAAADAARLRIEELFASLRAEKKQLQDEIGEWSEGERELDAQISRLRADRLPDQQAGWLLDYHIYDPKKGASFEYPLTWQNEAVAKLRRLSSEGNPK